MGEQSGEEEGGGGGEGGDEEREGHDRRDPQPCDPEKSSKHPFFLTPHVNHVLYLVMS